MGNFISLKLGEFSIVVDNYIRMLEEIKVNSILIPKNYRVELGKEKSIKNPIKSYRICLIFYFQFIQIVLNAIRYDYFSIIKTIGTQWELFYGSLFV